MMNIRPLSIRCWRACGVLLLSLWFVTSAHAAFFEDQEARKAILDLRQRIDTLHDEVGRTGTAASDENASLRNGLLDLQRQLELLRGDIATLRGANEQLARELSDFQRQQKDNAQTMNDRVSKLEPVKVEVDGIEFLAQPVEKRDFEAALAVFRKGDFAAAQNYFVAFVGRYPGSAYVSSALFWLGNAQYALRDYPNAIINFRALIARDPQHKRAPEAVLSVANCQLEMKDQKGARKTLADLIKAYPDSEAAAAAKERLAALK